MFKDSKETPYQNVSKYLPVDKELYFGRLPYKNYYENFIF
jgi:hypothetical protein